MASARLDEDVYRACNEIASELERIEGHRRRISMSTVIRFLITSNPGIKLAKPIQADATMTPE